MAALELAVGSQVWPVDLPADKAVELRREPTAPAAAAAGPREQVRDALERPFGFEPMRRACTPDDRVTIVLDDRLPHAAELVAGVLDHLGTAGIPPTAVTVLTAPPGDRTGWIDDLPDEYADVTAEVHDPATPQRHAYLATTPEGRRVYLNRTMIESDFVVVLTGRGYDPTFGYAGAEAAVFPALSNDETRAAFANQFSTDAPDATKWPARKEAGEVAWLLGTPFLVQVIEGPGDTVDAVVAGLLDSGVEGVRRQDARWRGRVDEQPQTVVATVSGPADRVDFADFARAAACAARVVASGGRIVLLSDAAPPLTEAADALRAADGPNRGAKAVLKAKPADASSALLWAFAAKQASLFLASGWPDETAEELFATPLRNAAEVQRLIDQADRVLVIPDAHKSMVTL